MSVTRLQRRSKTPGRKRSPSDRMSYCNRRKSLRLQQSMSLHIPTDEVDSTSIGWKCFIDLPKQVFNLTYLGDNETQNPDSLKILADLRKKRLGVFMLGYLENFTYQESEINSLILNLNNAFGLEVPLNNPDARYVTEVEVSDDLCVTEYDSNALDITVSQVWDDTGHRKQVLKGYLMSWCNEVRTSHTMLPLMLCQGRKALVDVMLKIIARNFDVRPVPLTLMQNDMIFLFTYCLAMLQETDNSNATLGYRIPSGNVDLMMPLPQMLKLWSHVHKGDSNEVDLDEVYLFFDALEESCETTFGFKLASAKLEQAKVNGHYCIHFNGQVSSTCTRIIHVMLKYLTYLAVQRLKVSSIERCFDHQQNSMQRSK